MAYNLAKQLIYAANGETIETVVITPSHFDTKTPQNQVYGIPISWSEAFPMLDYKYESAYECNNVIVWTDRSVICSQFVRDEVGAYLRFVKAPRNPEDFNYNG